MQRAKQRLVCGIALAVSMGILGGCASSSLAETDQVLFESTLEPSLPTEEALDYTKQYLSQVANSTQSYPDNLDEVAQPPAVLALLATNAEPRKFDRPAASAASQYMSLMGQDGTILTVWALGKRNWLWGYAPLDSHTFGNIRNWKMERSFRREHFRFINQGLGTCMQAYGNGVIHDTCNKNSLDQDFELMPTSTGSVFIKSVSQQRCITYNPVNTQGFDTIRLATCDDNITPLRDQNWYLTPPLLPAFADILPRGKA